MNLPLSAVHSNKYQTGVTTASYSHAALFSYTSEKFEICAVVYTVKVDFKFVNANDFRITYFKLKEQYPSLLM